MRVLVHLVVALLICGCSADTENASLGVDNGPMEVQSTDRASGWTRTDKIWSDAQCQNIGNNDGKTLGQCKQLCADKAGCTAFNFNPTYGGCSLRKCGNVVPQPNWDYEGIEGYYKLDTGVAHLSSGSGYIKNELKQCWNDKYGSYVSMADAKWACNYDSNCKGVYDTDCDGKGTYHLCPNDATYVDSGKSCIYDKTACKDKTSYCAKIDRKICDKPRFITRFMKRCKRTCEHCEPGYYPKGPQQNVPLSKVLSGGWKQCHSETYDKNTGSQLDQIKSSKCTGAYVMLACRSKSSNTITLLAAAPRKDVFTTTDTKHEKNEGKVSNGSKWYLYIASDKDKRSWGFANQNSKLNLLYCDFEGEQGSKRLCWNLNQGGFRCGSKQFLNSDTNWEKLIFTTN